MKYLLDTNAWIDVLNRPAGAVTPRLAGHPPSEVALCSITLAELLVGAYKGSQQSANLALIHQLMLQFTCLPFDHADADQYAQIRSHLERIGQPIGPYDMQIAAIARRHTLTVVTHNTAEFARVPGLTWEDWSVP
jgi:tRNA(fMet)-specific endonuclease VapC